MRELPSALRDAGVTAREADVLEALGARLTNTEIAEKLFISVRTVESHVSSLLRKLGAGDRLGLSGMARDALGSATGRAPLPIALAEAVARGPFVGRDEPLRALGTELDDVSRSRRRRLVLVTGEAGIGKSRLVAEFAAAAHGDGAHVAFGRCDEEALVPYQPFVEAVDGLADHVPAAVIERSSPALRPLLPSLPVSDRTDPAVVPIPDDPRLARHHLFESFDAVLAGAAQPLVLVLDDLHWADRSTLLLLRHLVRSAQRSPMLVVTAARREGLDPGSELAELVAALERDQEVPEVRLDGLTPAEIATLVERPDADAVAETTWARTGGNPFLVHHVLRHLDETGEAPLDASVPAPVREVVARRLARLAPDLLDMLAAGAVMGETFRFGVAARALDAPPSALLDAVDTVVSAGVVAEVPGEPDCYRFAHALVRDALVANLSSSRRAHLHLRIADELERTGADRHLAEIAHHLHAALPEGDPTRAARFAGRAAAEASTLLAWERAADLHAMELEALEEAPGGHEARMQALLARGRALLRAGDAGAARRDFLTAAEAARALGDAPSLAMAALGVGETSALWGDDPALVDLLEEVRQGLGDADAGLRARVTARLAQALYFSGTDEHRDRLSREALDDARTSGDPGTLAWVLSARHVALWNPADLQERVEAAREMLRVAEATGDDELAVRGSGWLGADLMEAGDFPGADGAFERHRELAGSLRQPLHRRDAEMWVAMWAMVAGNFGHAEVAMDRARDLGETAHDPDADTIWWIQRYWLLLERSDDEKDGEETDELVEPYERLAARYPQVPAWRGALALLHARRCDREAALTEFEALAVDDFGTIPRDAVWLNALTYCAETCAFLGDADRARILLALLEPYSDRVALIDRAIVCKGAVARFVGLLAATAGDDDTARRHLEAALARHEDAGAGPLADRTRRDLDRLVTGEADPWSAPGP